MKVTGMKVIGMKVISRLAVFSSSLTAFLSFLVLAPLMVQADAFSLPVIEPPYTASEQREPCADYDALRKPFYGDNTDYYMT